ncbi:uncharacterized protein LOC113437542 [Pseudonaja textilis]|uniref:uncharacterized protein LOC113437542 n=1 Tax=Pseudonaja textilis TaxID=8673 RepID=UPI000EAAA234|nr:uncharacterized protein LOC113437542 [Pseudonaja textilis]
MAVTKEAELCPQGPPRSQSPHQINGSCKKKEISVALNVQLFHLPPQAGVDQGADQDHMQKGFVLGDPEEYSEDTQDLIPGVIQDHTITDTGKDPILDIMEDILAHIQYINHGVDLLLDLTITGVTPEVNQEAEDTMGLEEQYVLKFMEGGEIAL